MTVSRRILALITEGYTCTIGHLCLNPRVTFGPSDITFYRRPWDWIAESYFSPVGNVITPSAIYSYTHELIGNRRALLLPSAITNIADGPSVIRYSPRK